MQTFVKQCSSVTCMYGDIRMVVFLWSIIWWNISPISLDITDTMVDYYAPRLQYTGYSNLNKYARWKATHNFKNQKQFKMVVNVWNHTKNHDILRHSSLCNHSSYTGPPIWLNDWWLNYWNQNLMSMMNDCNVFFLQNVYILICLINFKILWIFFQYVGRG